MDWWEKNVEFLHLYRSIVFIKKYPEEPLASVARRNYRKTKNQILHPRIIAYKTKVFIKNFLKNE